jgi:hypothetical protein
MTVRIPYVEHCPQCDAVVRCPPLTLRRASPDGVRAQYRCRVCLYSWWTCWTAENQPAEEF